MRNVLKWKYNKIVMMSLSDNEALRRQRYTSVFVFKQISYILSIKRFAELVYHTYSEVSLNEAKSFVIGSHVKDFCNRFTFTYKYKGTKQCETTNYLSAISYPEHRYQILFLTSPGLIPNSSLKHLAK